ncbi:MAG: nuclear transport factor 2 family protein [Acidobacteriaceae bacterium]
MYRNFLRFLSVPLLFIFLPSLLHSQTVVASPVSYAPSAEMQSSVMAPEIAEMQKVENLWDDAVNHRDQYGLELVLSPKLVDISSTGQVTNRDEQVAQIVQKNSPLLSLDQKVVSVRMLGGVAIVNGIYDIHFHPSTERKQAKEEKGVYSQVFERLRTSWVCINSQRTTLAQQTIRPGDKKKEASSNNKGLSNGLPFNFPGFRHKDTEQ